MIRINLLPYRAERTKENVRRQLFIFTSFFILVALIMVYYNGLLGGQVEDLSAKVESTRTELGKYKAIIKEIAEIKKKLDILNKKIAVIKNLDINRRKSVYLLDSMSRMVIAKRMWFTDFEEEGNILNVKGIALDNKTVADFMTRLERSYAGVTLKNLKKVRKKNVSLKSFQIKFQKATLVKSAPKSN